MNAPQVIATPPMQIFLAAKRAKKGLCVHVKLMTATSGPTFERARGSMVGLVLSPLVKANLDGMTSKDRVLSPETKMPGSISM